MLDDGVDMEKLCPHVVASARRITCIDISFGSLREQTFSNFHLSLKGSIRRPPNVISWVVMLLRMRTGGDSDTGSILRTWNASAPKHGQIVGSKSQTVKNLMEHADEAILAMLLDDVPQNGWDESPWSEEGLASKKIYPGSHFRTSHSKAWTKRQVITKESLRLMRRQICYYNRSVPHKHKLTKPDMEARAEKAVVVFNLGLELDALAKVPWTTIEQQFLDKWVQNDPAIELQVSSALIEKADNFKVRDLPCVAALIDERVTPANFQTSSTQALVDADTKKLEESTFKLVMLQLLRDANVWRVFLANCSNYEVAAYTKKMQWTLDRHLHGTVAAKAFLKALFCLFVTSQPEDTRQRFNEFLREVSKKHCIGLEHIVVFGFLNWIAPCTQPSASLVEQANMMSQVVTLSEKNIRLTLNPQFTYKRGQLYLSEKMTTDLLVQRGLNFDNKWSINFETKPDARDGRPLMLDGRIIIPSGIKEAEFLF